MRELRDAAGIREAESTHGGAGLILAAEKRRGEAFQRGCNLRKVLIVDDSEHQRFQLRKDLESAGHLVIEGCDAHDGLEKLWQNPDVALIICDVNMPGMDGITMCSKVFESAKFPGLPIFMLTSEASAELKKSAKQYGVRAWITKPYVASKLLEAVQKVTNK